MCYGKTRLPLHLKKSSWWQCSLRKEIKNMSVIATYVVYVHMLLRIVQDNTWRSSLRGSGSGKSVIDPKHCTHLYTAEDWSGLNILSCILTGGYRSRSRHCRVELQGYTHTHTTLKQLSPTHKQLAVHTLVYIVPTYTYPSLSRVLKCQDLPKFEFFGGGRYSVVKTFQGGRVPSTE